METSNRENFKIPSKLQMPLEILGLVEGIKLFWSLPELTKEKTGKGETILVIPGFASDDNFLIPLRNFLQTLGYDTRGWGLGFNHGSVPELLEPLNKLLNEIYSEKQRKVHLIGWSLGGYLAREIARDNPTLVDKLVTLGSPIIGGPKYTSIAALYSAQHGVDLDALEKEIDQRESNPIQNKILSIYSINDNIVSPNACIDRLSPKATNVEVEGTHIGLIVNPEVYKLIKDFLA
ncbi:MAG: alpha/beta hydrolase [Leptospiraceae bacterium]|nr:alpha/beta hydrolase [Leptospiraceae bacterium]